MAGVKTGVGEGQTRGVGTQPGDLAAALTLPRLVEHARRDIQANDARPARQQPHELEGRYTRAAAEVGYDAYFEVREAGCHARAARAPGHLRGEPGVNVGSDIEQPGLESHGASR